MTRANTRDVDELSKVTHISAKEIEHVMNSMAYFVSTHSIIADDLLVEDTLAAEELPNVFDKCEFLDNKSRAEECLSRLSPKERAVIKYRFGIDDDAPKTLQEIGDIYGVSRERIRQIEAEALIKVRRHMLARHSAV